MDPLTLRDASRGHLIRDRYFGRVSAGGPDVGWSSDPEVLVEQVKVMAAGMDVDDLRAVALSLLQAGSGPVGVPPPAARQSRRRPRQQELHTYRIRVDLAGARTPIWRLLDVSSDLMLDDLHVAIQTAFGWTDSHLHRFGVGEEIWDRDTEVYLCPFDVDEGDDEGVPEDQVRLDEVLADVGDSLLYVYDYGDNWQHAIRLEAISDRAAVSPLSVCVDGGRACPPEDCGGVHGYEEMLADAADPASDEHAEAVESLGFYGGETAFDPSQFDRDEADASLESALDPAVRAAYHSPKLGWLLRAVQGRGSGAAVLDVVRAARLDESVEVNVETAAAMTRRFTWLLSRVGDEGIKLTAAGYLPPVHVEAAMAELGMHEEWIGKGNREDLTLPVLEMREAAQQLGLLRKYRGRLLLTKQAQRLRGDPLALWWHIAGRMPRRRAQA